MILVFLAIGALRQEWSAAREVLVSLERQQRDADSDRRDRAQDLDDLALALVVLAGPRSFRLAHCKTSLAVADEN